jgi:hypothetical protein
MEFWARPDNIQYPPLAQTVNEHLTTIQSQLARWFRTPHPRSGHCLRDQITDQVQSGTFIIPWQMG